MLWLKKKRREQHLIEKRKIEKEIAGHQQAAKKVVAKFQNTVDRFNKDFEENHFTVKIFSAMGGKDPKQKLRTH